MKTKIAMILIGFLVVLPILNYAFTYGNLTAYLVTKPIPYDQERRVYTPICLGECHMVLNFSWGGSDFTLQKNELGYIKSKIVGTDKLINIKVQYLANVSYQDTICISYNNSDIIELRTCLATQQVTKWKAIWKDLPDTIPIVTDKWYIIDLIGYKSISSGFNAVDIVPIIKGINLNAFAWWNTSFTKCKNITYTYTGLNSTLTNGNVYLNVTYDSDMRADYGDIRFVDSYCNNATATELDYWTEAYNTNYWLGYVEINSLSNSSTRLGAMYYGYASATTKSNVVTTFYFGDDFEDNDATDWVASMSTQSSYRLNDSASSYGFSAPNSAEQYKTMTSITSNTFMTYMWYLYSSGSADASWYNGLRTSASSNLILWKTNAMWVYTLNPAWINISLKFEANRWHKLILSGSSSGSWNYTLDFLNGTTQTSTSVGDAGTDTIARFVIGDYSGATEYGDATIGMNYVDKAITSSFGAEETYVGGTPTGTTLYLDGGVGNITHEYSSSAGTNMTGITNVTGMYVALYVNGTLSGNTTTGVTNTTIFKVGVYNVTAVNYGNATFTGSSSTLWVNITKQVTGMSLYLDGTQANRTYTYLASRSVNATGVINITGLPVSIYVNNTYKAMGTSSMEYDQVYGFGAWNITSMYAGDENHTSSSATWWLNITKGYNNMYFSLANSSYSVVATTYGGGWLYASGTEYGGNEFLHLVYPDSVASVGSCLGGGYNMTYNSTNNITEYVNNSYLSGYTPTTSFELNCKENANYTFNHSYIYFDVAKGTPTINITFNTSDTVIINTPVNVSCNYPSGFTVNLYNNTSNISNPLNYNATILGAINFTCNSTSTANYTYTTTNKLLTVASSGALMINAVYDENTLAPLIFNLTIYNDTFSQITNNIYNYNSANVSGNLTLAIVSNGYVARKYYISTNSSLVVNVTGYLLKTTDGVYPSFWCYSANNPTGENGTQVNVTRFIGSSWTLIGQETSDFEGKGTFYFSPYATYRITAYKSGVGYIYIDSYSANPSVLIKLYLAGVPTNTSDFTGWLFTNLTYSLEPTNIFISPSATNLTLFNYTLIDSASQVQYYGLSLTYNGLQIYSNNVSGTGGSITVNFNMSGRSGILVAKTWFSKSGTYWAWNRTYSIYVPSSWFTNMTASLNMTGLGGGYNLGLSAMLGNLIGLFVALSGGSMVKRTPFSDIGGGIMFLLILAIFVFFGWFSWLIYLSLVMIEVILVMGNKYW